MIFIASERACDFLYSD